MYHLFSFPRDEKDKRQMLILDTINFVLTSKQSYKFLSIVKGIIYWSATLQYQDEFYTFLDNRIYVILSSKHLQTNRNLFYKLYLTWKQRKHIFSCSKNCAAWMKWEDKQGPYCLNGRAKNEPFFYLLMDLLTSFGLYWHIRHGQLKLGKYCSFEI